MKKKETIIFIAAELASFVRTDLELLTSTYDIRLNAYRWTRKYLVPFLILGQVVFMLRHTRKSKRILVHFGFYGSLIPVIFGKIFRVPSFIILHGTDCANVPAIGYGSMRKKLLRWVCGQAYRRATLLLPVSSSLVYVRNTYLEDDGHSEQGYRHFFPAIKTPYRILYNGLDEVFWHPLEGSSRDPGSFVTVLKASQFQRKGGDLITMVADRFPENTFYFAGMEKQADRTFPGNVVFTGWMTRDGLRELFSRCGYYLQLSVFEGFGLSLCEAMLCGCIPIGSSANVIPEIIGDTGYVLEVKDADRFVSLLRTALSEGHSEERGARARSRIIDRYSLQRRKDELLSILGSEEPGSLGSVE